MLHFERKRLKAVKEAEAKSQNVWTGNFEDAVRVKIYHALKDAGDGADAWIAACNAAQRRLATPGIVVLCGRKPRTFAGRSRA
jgi:hypothetical protein